MGDSDQFSVTIEVYNPTGTITEEELYDGIDKVMSVDLCIDKGDYFISISKTKSG